MLSKIKVRPMVGQSVFMRAGSFVCAFIPKENGLWKDSPCHWGGCQSKQNTADAQPHLKSPQRMVQGRCQGPGSSQDQCWSCRLTFKPWTHEQTSKPFLKLTSKAIPTVGRGITAPSFFQELMCSHCFA